MKLSSFFDISRKFFSQIPQSLPAAHAESLEVIDQGFVESMRAGRELSETALFNFLSELIKVLDLDTVTTLSEAIDTVVKRFELQKEYNGLATVFTQCNKGLANTLIAYYFILKLPAPVTIKEVDSSTSYHSDALFGMTKEFDADTIESVCLDNPSDGDIEIWKATGQTVFCIATRGSSAPKSQKYSYFKGSLKRNHPPSPPIWIAKTSQDDAGYLSFREAYCLNEIIDIPIPQFVGKTPNAVVGEKKDLTEDEHIKRLVYGWDSTSAPSTILFPRGSPNDEKVFEPGHGKRLLDDTALLLRFFDTVAAVETRSTVMLEHCFREHPPAHDYVLTEQDARDITRYLSIVGLPSRESAKLAGKFKSKVVGDVNYDFLTLSGNVMSDSGSDDRIGQLFDANIRDYSGSFSVDGARECVVPENFFMQLIKEDTGVIRHIAAYLPAADYLSGAFDAKKYALALKVMAFMLGRYISTRSGSKSKYTVLRVEEHTVSTFCIFLSKTVGKTKYSRYQQRT